MSNKKLFTSFFATLIFCFIFNVGLVSANSQTLDAKSKKATNKEEYSSILENNFMNSKFDFEIRVDNMSFEDIEKVHNDLNADYIINYSYYIYYFGNKPFKVLVTDVEYYYYHYLSKAIKTGDTSYLGPKGQAIYKKSKQVIDQIIKPGMTDFQKEKAVNDYIILNTRYDKVNADNDTLPISTRSAYGVIIDGVAVCGGYSDAFKIFMDMLNIECDFIIGESRGVGHGWNRVKIDGEYYLIDVTWNDGYEEFSTEISYEYFNLTDAEMNIDHRPNQISNKISDGTKYNFYNYYGLVVRDQDSLEKLLEKAVYHKKKSITFQLENIKFRDLDLNAIAKFYNGKINYTENQTRKIITIYFN